MKNYVVPMIDIDGTPTRVGFECAAEAPDTDEIVEKIDKLTHAQILQLKEIVNVDLSAASFKAAPTSGSFADRTYKLNCTFRHTDGTIVKYVITCPKAEIEGIDATTIFLLPANGGQVPPTLPVGEIGLAGDDIATSVELIKGFAVGSLTFLSGSLTKNAR